MRPGIEAHVNRLGERGGVEGNARSVNVMNHALLVVRNAANLERVARLGASVGSASERVGRTVATLSPNFNLLSARREPVEANSASVHKSAAQATSIGRKVLSNQVVRSSSDLQNQLIFQKQKQLSFSLTGPT